MKIKIIEAVETKSFGRAAFSSLIHVNTKQK